MTTAAYAGTFVIMNKTHIFLLIVLWSVIGCTERRGAVVHSFTAITKSTDETTQLKSRVQHFLNGKGFTLSDDPGGMQSWSGIHTSGGAVQWYKGSYDGSAPLLVRFSELERHNDKVEFACDVAWQIEGSHNDIVSMEESVKKLVHELNEVSHHSVE